MVFCGSCRTKAWMCLATACWFASSGLFSVSADDNLLGLPESLDKDRPGAVMLHGGGLVTEDTLDEFIELAGGREAKLIFVPSAGFRLDSYADEEEFLDAVSTRYSAWSRTPGRACRRRRRATSWAWALRKTS